MANKKQVQIKILLNEEGNGADEVWAKPHDGGPWELVEEAEVTDEDCERCPLHYCPISIFGKVYCIRCW